MNEKLVHPELSYLITGVCFEVHNQLGRFCREKQYGDVLEEKFLLLKIDYKREYTVGVTGNRIDFLIEDKIILEIKAKPLLLREDYYQTQRYLQVLNKKLGLIINFRNKYIRPKRVIRIDTDMRSKFASLV